MKNIGEKIKKLRKEKGVSQKELAKSLKMTSAQLCRIEGGKNVPSIKTLARIANAMGLSIAELMEGDAPAVEKPSATSVEKTESFPEGDTLVPVRRKALPLEDTDGICKQIRGKNAQYDEIESELGVASASTLPICFTFSSDERGAEILARALRSACEAGSTPFTDLPALLQSKRVRIVAVRAAPDVRSGCFFDTSNRTLSIAVNRKLAPERQIYQIAYELGYACLFGSMGYSTVVESHETHKFARHFAAAFLMPEEAIKTFTSQLALGPKDWNMQMLLQLKHRFGVDAETFAVRLERIGELSPSLLKQFREELGSYAEKHGGAEPPPTIRPLNVDTPLNLLKLRAASA